MNWLITYTVDFGRTEQTRIIFAATYTSAYVSAMGENVIILDIKQI